METVDHAFISIRHLEKSYWPKKVLRGVDLEVNTGTTMVVLGGSGEGKSVLLRHLNGLERPDSGEVWIDGQNLNLLGEEELAPIRSKVAIVFQQGALFDSLRYTKTSPIHCASMVKLTKGWLVVESAKFSQWSD